MSVAEVEKTEQAITLTVKNQEIRVYGKPDDKGKLTRDTVQLVTNTDFTKWEEKNPDWQLGIQETLRMYTPNTLQAFVDLIEDEDEALAIAIRGIKQKYSQRLPQIFLALTEEGAFEYTGTEGEVYDTRALLQEESRRKIMDPYERALRDVKKASLSQEQLLALIATLQVPTE